MSDTKQMKERPHNALPMGRGAARAIGRPVEKAKNLKGTLGRLLAYLRPHRLTLAVMFILMIVTTVLNALSPMMLGRATTEIFYGITDAAKGGVNFLSLGKILGTTGIVYLLTAVCTFITQRGMAIIALKTVYRMRKEMDEKLARVPLTYYDARPHGEIMSRITNDVDNVNNALQQSLPQLLTSGIGVIGATVMMLIISPFLTLVVVLSLPLSILITTTIAKRSQKYYVEQQKALGEANGHIEEMMGGHAIVKAYGYEKKSITRFCAINDRLYTSGWKAQFITGIIFPLMNFVSNIAYILVCALGGIFVLNKTLEVGNVQAFIQYVRSFTQPIVQSASTINMLQSAAASAERIFEVLDAQEETPDPPYPAIIEHPEGRIRMENVSFGYTNAAPLFEGLSFSANPGNVIAIVGPTGAGKTTLVNLLMRFYEIDKGIIEMDGVNAKSMRRSDVRRAFGMALQDAWLFDATIRENIAYGKSDATNEEIVAAAKTAQAYHFIRALPNGFDTILKGDASNISQGEKQLLTIARALIADPEFFILDEATSNVDTRTEILIQKAMATLMRGRTSFVIAHRLSTIRNANHILVMNHGAIIEQGTHTELLAANGFYAELYRAQFSGNA